MDHRDGRAAADLMRMLATMPPAIVTAEPRYQQRVFHSEDFLIAHDDHHREESRAMPLWNLDGVAWVEAAPPPLWHRHWAQTVALLWLGEEMWRCPCGAHGAPHRPWIHLSRDAARRRPWVARWWRRRHAE